MSQVGELLSRLAPEGVRHVELGEIARTVSGLSGKSKADFTDGNARYVSYKNAFANSAVDLGAEDFVKVLPSERQNALRRGDIVITGSSENVEDVGMSSVVLEQPEEPLYLNSFCFALRLNEPGILVPAFSKHLFRSHAVRAQIRLAGSGVTRINISKPRFLRVTIPVPPLEVQREIVRILDQFAGLEAELGTELEAELKARMVQYAHYRSSFFSRAQERVVPLGELLELKAGKFIAAAEISQERDESSAYPCFGGNGIRGFVPEWSHEGDHVLIGRQGALSGNVRRASGRFYATEHAVVASPREEIDTSWLFHALTAMNLNQYVSKGAQPGLAVTTLNNVTVEVPPLHEQTLVGETLDRFDALVNDLSIGLPAERAARRKQYEYYRDKLLTFEEARA